MAKRVAFIHEEPDTYRIPFFNRIKYKKLIELQVFYCNKSNPYRGGELELGKSKGFSEILPGMKIKIPFIKTENYFNPSILRKLSDGKFDYVIVGGYYHLTMLISIFWALVHNVPFIIISESNFLSRQSKIKSLVKSILLTPVIKRASAYLPLGKYAGDYLTYYGAKKDNMFYFPNTPDIDYFIKESDEYRNEKPKIKKDLGLDTKFVILFVGRLVKEKGLFTLIRAFKEVKEAFTDLFLLIVGDGELKDELKEFVSREEINDVHFTGVIQNKELPKYYGISDIFVLTSYYEPWGVVVNEAMASGLPIIISDKVGAKGDLLLEGGNGYSFQSNNFIELKECILSLLKTPDLINKMGQNSRKIIKKFVYSYCEKNLKMALSECMK